MITIENATRNYGKLVAVSDVSLSIEHGEIVGLLGHNGAGKTTLMKMLTGYLEPTSGSITVDDNHVVDDRLAVQRHIGYLPENAPLYPEMLVQEYLLMMAELRGVAAADRERAVSIAASRTGLGEHLLRPISELSKGFRQRVGLAQAIVHEPRLLVLDEPTNGLDPVQIQSIRDLIVRLGRNATIILSTHILQEVEAVCDRVLIMIGGKLSADESLVDMLTSHTIRLSVKGDADVRKGLQAIDDIVQVRNLGNDPAAEGFMLWALDHTPGTTPTHAVLQAASAAGWEIGAIHPERKTLEGVFKDLQNRHIANLGAAA